MSNPSSCTPCDASVTVSRSGHFVALIRRRNSVSSASGDSGGSENQFLTKHVAYPPGVRSIPR